MESFKKYCAEFIGTAVLIIFGCGTAMTIGTSSVNGSGYIMTALAFGFAYMGMFYCIGHISGCHLNPAVSIGVFVAGKMTAGDFFGYIIAQFIGAFAGSELLAWIWHIGRLRDVTGDYFSNTTAVMGITGSFVIEIILTFVFVFVAVGVISKREYFAAGGIAAAGGVTAAGGIAAGFTLTLVHIFGIAFTNASVNPARSLATALTSLIAGDKGPISDVWVFILASIIGGAFAAGIYKALQPSEKDK